MEYGMKTTNIAYNVTGMTAEIGGNFLVIKYLNITKIDFFNNIRLHKRSTV